MRSSSRLWSNSPTSSPGRSRPAAPTSAAAAPPAPGCSSAMLAMLTAATCTLLLLLDMPAHKRWVGAGCSNGCRIGTMGHGQGWGSARSRRAYLWDRGARGQQRSRSRNPTCTQHHCHPQPLVTQQYTPRLTYAPCAYPHHLMPWGMRSTYHNHPFCSPGGCARHPPAPPTTPPLQNPHLR